MTAAAADILGAALYIPLARPRPGFWCLRRGEWWMANSACEDDRPLATRHSLLAKKDRVRKNAAI
jgi:hypothetical protein